MSDQETEITLGNGRLLGLFIGLVVLCGVFFVMGYMLGKNSAPGNTLLTDATSSMSGDGAIKPGAIQSVATPTPVQTPTPAVQPAAEPSSTNEPEAPAQAPEPAPEPAAPEVTRRVARPASATPVVRPAATATSAGSFIVQVAAVSKQQDADALAAALRRKQYTVTVSSQTPDKLYHVQIGPFSDSKLAEMVRSRLVADGYNPIVKK
jgi:cell division septation protein DedD